MSPINPGSSESDAGGDALMRVENLEIVFETSLGPLAAVRDMSFRIRPGETVALVGESGSGKSTTALALLRLLPGQGTRTSGRVHFEGQDLLTLPDAAIRHIRGGRIGMIFQDPSMALNPVLTIGDQLIESLRLHVKLTHKEAVARCLELLRLVRVSAPEERLRQYPHHLSGGMRQRVMIAMALSCGPSLLIADEPTTALDVTVQADVLAIIDDLKQSLGMAVLLITHDLGVVWETASRVIVMYAGRKVEEGPVEQVLRRPGHPYTAGLLRAAQWDDVAGGRLFEIPGTVPSATSMPPGCAFAPRCPRAQADCEVGVTPYVSLPPRESALPSLGTSTLAPPLHEVACRHPESSLS